MKKSLLIITGLVLALAFTGCTRGSSVSDAGNKPLEAISTFVGTEFATENTTKEYLTEAPTEEPTVGETETDYNSENAKRVFEESDIPDSIKSIFLANGDFVDTQTNTTATLKDYKVYETKLIYDESDPNAIPREGYDFENWNSVAEWSEYISVDFDNDGKKELFFVYWVGSGNQQGVIFHEHTDGKVYAYGHQSLRVHIGENGDVVGSGGADLSANILQRYSFDTEKIIKTKIAYAEFVDNNEYKYYAEGKEVDFDKFSKYFGLLSDGSLNWTKFRITPDSSGN